MAAVRSYASQSRIIRQRVVLQPVVDVPMARSCSLIVRPVCPLGRSPPPHPVRTHGISPVTTSGVFLRPGSAMVMTTVWTNLTRLKIVPSKHAVRTSLPVLVLEAAVTDVSLKTSSVMATTTAEILQGKVQNSFPNVSVTGEFCWS